MRQFGAVLADECDVLTLEADSTRVTSLNCRFKNESITLRGRVVILAAGAVQTPALLLRSANTDWPDGLRTAQARSAATSCGTFWTIMLSIHATSRRTAISSRQLGLNDLYHADGVKMARFNPMAGCPLHAASRLG